MENKDWESRVAYLGPEASFTHLAAGTVFAGEWLMPYATIPECIEAVANGEVEFAVVPLENALEGSVPLTIDYLFHDVELHVSAEILSRLNNILWSHPQQVGNWQ
ncbi:hypothetical protein JQK62_23595, partial [Leptospira santarosai]|nr:hypothetical protein [Leptospira santarosai]